MNLPKTAKLVGAALLTLGLATGCANQDQASAQAPSAAELAAQSSINQATAELKLAVDQGYAWRDTGKLIKKAEASLKSGDYDKAEVLANEASMQSQIARNQSIQQTAAVAQMFPSAVSANKSIAKAKDELKTATEEGYAWRDTGKMIKKAEAAVADGDYAKAEKIAAEAIMQSEMARTQQAQQEARVEAMFSTQG